MSYFVFCLDQCKLNCLQLMIVIKVFDHTAEAAGSYS